MGTGSALLFFLVLGITVTVASVRAAWHNLLLWWRTDRSEPLVPIGTTTEVTASWPVSSTRARQWPQPSTAPGARQPTSYWAAYARLAAQEAQRKRLFAQGGLVVAGTWLGLRAEPLLSHFGDTARGEVREQPVILLPGATWQEGLLNLAPLWAVAFFVLLLWWADTLEAMREAYAHAAAPEAPRASSPPSAACPGTDASGPAAARRRPAPVLVLLGWSALGVALGLLAPKRRHAQQSRDRRGGGVTTERSTC